MSRPRSSANIAGALLLCASLAAAPAAAAQDIPAASTSLASPPAARLAALGHRLSLSNAQLCASPQILSGLMVHDRSSYTARERDSVARRYALGQGFGILNVVPGSAAERAGLRAGDELVGLSGGDLGAFRSDLVTGRGAYARVAAFLEHLGGALSAGSAQVAYRRGAEQHAATIEADFGCGGEVVVMPERDLNAWSDGRYVAVTARMMEYASSDDQLAFVVAHEMAHNILGHSDDAGHENGLFPGGRKQSAKEQEFAADAMAISLMAGAGYDLQAANRFLARTRKSRWMDIPLSHPGIKRRMEGVDLAIARLDQSGRVQFASLDRAPVPPGGAAGSMGEVQPQSVPRHAEIRLASLDPVGAGAADLKAYPGSRGLAHAKFDPPLVRCSPVSFAPPPQLGWSIDLTWPAGQPLKTGNAFQYSGQFSGQFSGIGFAGAQAFWPAALGRSCSLGTGAPMAL